MGPVPTRDGTSFSVYSGGAERMQLCLFEPSGESRIDMERASDGVWHTEVAGAEAGSRYGFRADGPFVPSQGLRYNPSKLLLDPYARFIEGHLAWSSEVSDPPDRRNAADSARSVPRSVVVSSSFDWGEDAPPRTPWASTVIYETHVKGFSIRNPDVPLAIRGTYAGLASPASIEHLLGLGVTAVELLPVQHHIDDRRLVEAGLSNYWGFQTIGFFAPHAGYAASLGPGEAVDEFKQMVKDLHAAGLEVILDVAYNHSGEGGDRGPTLCFRGLDNPAYYRLDPGDRSRYVDVTGVENTLNVSHPVVSSMILDSLRYWASEMHVDGFRFDLAVTLGRDPEAFSEDAELLRRIGEDPILSRLKLIAEPWDLGSDGYQLGRFPRGWAEWNDRFRDDVRDLWRGQTHVREGIAERLSGSPDVFGDRAPWASINSVTAHDGFTLRDLVSYEQKHNLANEEDDRDGSDHNRSWNCGVEGDTEDETVNASRDRYMRALMATMLLAAGVPMVLGGDEMRRTQGGNNNAYCHDGPVSWLHWDLGPQEQMMVQATKRFVEVRTEIGAGRTWTRLHDRSASGCLVMCSDDLLLVINPDPVPGTLSLEEGTGWYKVLDTSEPTGGSGEGPFSGKLEIQEHSLVLLRASS